MMTLKEFKERYPQIAFNDDPAKRNRDHYLFQMDTAMISPASYDVKNIKQYKGVITWNSKVYSQLISWGAQAFKIGEYPRFNDYGKIEEFTYIEDKKGVCIIEHNNIHDISHKQTEVFMDIVGLPHFAYGQPSFGGQYHKGELHNKTDQIRALDKHKFAICFENVYHPLWSYNYLSESIFNCFRAKTIPVYLGAYNIDELVPPHFFINYNDFRNNEELSDYLVNFNMNMYEEITEKAYQWAINNQWNPNKLIVAFNKL